MAQIRFSTIGQEGTVFNIMVDSLQIPGEKANRYHVGAKYGGIILNINDTKKRGLDAEKAMFIEDMVNSLLN